MAATTPPQLGGTANLRQYLLLCWWEGVPAGKEFYRTEGGEDTRIGPIGPIKHTTHEATLQEFSKSISEYMSLRALLISTQLLMRRMILNEAASIVASDNFFFKK